MLSSAIRDAVQDHPGGVVMCAAFTTIDGSRQLLAVTMKSRFRDVDYVRAGTEVLSQKAQRAQLGAGFKIKERPVSTFVCSLCTCYMKAENLIVRQRTSWRAHLLMGHSLILKPAPK